MSRGLEDLLSLLVTERRLHSNLRRDWENSPAWPSEMGPSRFHSSEIYRVDQKIERVLNLLNRDLK